MFAEEAFEGRARTFTRISVQSLRDGFSVSIGGARPVRVVSRGSMLKCDCGAPGCVHVYALRACGFLADDESLALAA